jgi:hypothetical protein
MGLWMCPALEGEKVEEKEEVTVEMVPQGGGIEQCSD